LHQEHLYLLYECRHQQSTKLEMFWTMHTHKLTANTTLGTQTTSANHTARPSSVNWNSHNETKGSRRVPW